jgi:hypothetical protein
MSDSDSEMPRLVAAGAPPRPLRRLKKAGAARKSTDAPAGVAGRAAGTATTPHDGGHSLVDLDADRGATSPSPAPSAGPSDVSNGAPLTAGGARPMHSPAARRRPRAKSADDDEYWDEEDELAEDLARGRSVSPTEGEGGREAGAAGPADTQPAADAAPPTGAPAAAGEGDDDDEGDAPSGSYSEYTDTESGSMQLDDLHAETARLLRGEYLFFQGERERRDFSIHPTPLSLSSPFSSLTQKPPAPTAWARAPPPRSPSPWTACWPA